MLVPAAVQNPQGIPPLPQASSSVLRATDKPAAAGLPASAPIRSWAGDITYIRTKAGCDLAVWIDSVKSAGSSGLETRQPDLDTLCDRGRSTSPSCHPPGRTREAA